MQRVDVENKLHNTIALTQIFNTSIFESGLYLGDAIRKIRACLSCDPSKRLCDRSQLMYFSRGDKKDQGVSVLRSMATHTGTDVALVARFSARVRSDLLHRANSLQIEISKSLFQRISYCNSPVAVASNVQSQNRTQKQVVNNLHGRDRDVSGRFW